MEAFFSIRDLLFVINKTSQYCSWRNRINKNIALKKKNLIEIIVLILFLFTCRYLRAAPVNFERGNDSKQPQDTWYTWRFRVPSVRRVCEIVSKISELHHYTYIVHYYHSLPEIRSSYASDEPLSSFCGEFTSEEPLF